jgi:CBS domain-containing protein
MRLSEIMTKPVQTVTPSASLVDAAKKMLEEDVGSLPVCEDSKVVGVITDRDIAVRAVAKSLNPAQTKVQQVMTREVHFHPADADVEDAFRLMAEKQIRRLVVTDNSQHPIGIVSLGDIALCLREEKAGELLKEVSKPT